ncbi:Ceramide-1-phosphate transfer protein [Hondaea fermentalgiana]|uniref:Ceramide-1-phosphate transfer protein n=1 Tax=Hondaea fermentalgiana TaxID=2315210 RepID=A0A2R5GH57_9STRA|nr:Ceramide-1-phosphate transfer protein [Hondaea fermentalgiana]|eukprot:GBG29925.1 Ceramide-1-phosphate transfer protein [Hondaea fermentalgiana]
MAGVCPCFHGARDDAEATEVDKKLALEAEWAPQPVEGDDLRAEESDEDDDPCDGEESDEDNSEVEEDVDGRAGDPKAADEDEVQLLSYESLVELAKDLWTQATQYLMPDEVAEAEKIHEEDLQRMDTLELREHVVATRDVQMAVQDLVDSGEATGDEVANAQRSSLNLGGSKSNFDGDLFAAILAKSINEDRTINAALFLQASQQVPVLVGGLGRTFEFASADLDKKMSITETRLTETAQDLGIDRSDVSLQDMVERDIRLGITHDGKKAAPASRTILRLIWFLDFTGGLLQECADSQDQDLRTICSKVYEDTLAPRHNWLLRKAARSGMRLLPAKHIFRVRLGTVELSEEDEAEKLSGWASKVHAVSEIMWDFMKENGIEELP